MPAERPFLVATLVLVACGGGAVVRTGEATSGSSGAASTTSSSSSSSGLPACTWPANLDPPEEDGGPPPWQVARAFLVCKYGDQEGVTTLCLSNDPTTCPNEPKPGPIISDCVDRCSPNEYAVATLLGVGSPPQPDLPASCQHVTATTAGVYWCCPCE